MVFVRQSLSRHLPLIAAFLASALVLLAPAVWNRFPFLFFDSGAYLERPFDGTLSAGRSMVYGVWLAALRFYDFWPAAIAQCALTVWLVYLVLRSHGLRDRPILLPLALFAVVSFHAAGTALPWFAAQLMPDLFAALAVLALYLLLFKHDTLHWTERCGLIALIVFACTAHNGTYAVILALSLAALMLFIVARQLVPAAALRSAVAAVLLAAIFLPSVNYLFAGKFAWTSGGTSFIFSRLVQDGIVARYLADNCPDPSIKLCKFQKQLPKTADDFLWHQGQKGPFVSIGGWDEGADEMKRIALDSLAQYPAMHLKTAFYSTGLQLIRVETGDGIVRGIWSAYAAIERLAPESRISMHTSRQRFDMLAPTFKALNAIHVPITLAAMTLLPLLLFLAWRRREIRDVHLFAATIILALLANAFVMGVLSNPHHRYGARLAWTAPFVWSVVLIQLLVTSRAWQEAAMRWLISAGLLPKPAVVPVPAREIPPAAEN
jgi:hypothetical protein